MNLSRRSLIAGLVSLVAAPAIVRASSLMPVRALRHDVISEEWIAAAQERLRRKWVSERGGLYASLQSGDLKFEGGAINWAKPAPGWRFRTLASGAILHEPDPRYCDGKTVTWV
jgi:hypothetical protein